MLCQTDVIDRCVIQDAVKGLSEDCDIVRGCKMILPLLQYVCSLDERGLIRRWGRRSLNTLLNLPDTSGLLLRIVF
jgi:hypothetical protein